MLKKLILPIGLAIVIIGIILSTSILSSEKNTDNSDNNSGKKLTEFYEFGNFFDNGLKSGTALTILDQGNQKASIRFTNSISGKVTGITLAVSTNNSQQVSVGLQEDDGNGNPVGQWLGDNPINLIISKVHDQTFTFSNPIMIEENKIYHIVIESENATKTDYIKIKNYHKNTPYQPYNKINPDIYQSDSSINSLYFENKKWIEEEKWPMFLITFEDGNKIGQPYTLAAGWVIRDKTWVGQTFIPSSDYAISKVSFVVSKEGNPDQPLYYGIQDTENNILSSGLFSGPQELSWEKKWIEVSLDKPVFFESEKLYRIYLYSPIPKSDEFYRVYGHEYSYDYNSGYGETRHRLTISHDYGESWSAWYDADAIFKLST